MVKEHFTVTLACLNIRNAVFNTSFNFDALSICVCVDILWSQSLDHRENSLSLAFSPCTTNVLTLTVDHAQIHPFTSLCLKSGKCVRCLKCTVWKMCFKCLRSTLAYTALDFVFGHSLFTSFKLLLRPTFPSQSRGNRVHQRVKY